MSVVRSCTVVTIDIYYRVRGEEEGGGGGGYTYLGVRYDAERGSGVGVKG